MPTAGAFVTYKGRDFVTGYLAGTYGTATNPLKSIGWGFGGATANTFFSTAVAIQTNVAAYYEATEARTTGTASIITTTTVNDTYQLIGTLTTSGAEQIGETLISDTATKPFFATVTTGATSVIGSTTNTNLYISTNYTPANNTYVQVDNEVMQVTAGSGGTALTVVRAQNGTTAYGSIAAGDGVTLGNIPGGSVANASLFAHATFVALSLNTGDSIQFTWKVQVTS